MTDAGPSLPARSRKRLAVAYELSVQMAMTAFLAAAIVIYFFRGESDVIGLASPFLIVALESGARAVRRPRYRLDRHFDNRIPTPMITFVVLTGICVVAYIVYSIGAPHARLDKAYWLSVLTPVFVIIYWSALIVYTELVRRSVAVPLVNVPRFDVALHDLPDPSGVGLLMSKVHRHLPQEARFSIATDGRLLEAWELLERFGQVDEPKLSKEFDGAVAQAYLDGRHTVDDVCAALTAEGFEASYRLSG